jgi:hypothetical protein
MAKRSGRVAGGCARGLGDGVSGGLWGGLAISIRGDLAVCGEIEADAQTAGRTRVC